MQWQLKSDGWEGKLGNVRMGSKVGMYPDLPEARSWRYVKQVHRSKVLDDEHYVNEEQEADGLVTSIDGVGLVIRTADCVPIHMTDGDKIAMIHAGWRSVAQGIVARAVGFFEPKTLYAMIGPAISQANYEVDDDLYLPWSKRDKRIHDHLEDHGAGSKRLFDLKGLVRRLLLDSDLLEDHLLDVGICTFASSLPSYRREGADADRLHNYILKSAH